MTFVLKPDVHSKPEETTLAKTKKKWVFKIL